MHPSEIVFVSRVNEQPAELLGKLRADFRREMSPPIDCAGLPSALDWRAADGAGERALGDWQREPSDEGIAHQLEPIFAQVFVMQDDLALPQPRRLDRRDVRDARVEEIQQSRFLIAFVQSLAQLIPAALALGGRRHFQAEIKRRQRVAQIAEDDEAFAAIQLGMREDLFARHKHRRVHAARFKNMLREIAARGLRDPASALGHAFAEKFVQHDRHPRRARLRMGEVHERRHCGFSSQPFEQSGEHARVCNVNVLPIHFARRLFLYMYQIGGFFANQTTNRNAHTTHPHRHHHIRR